MSNSVTTVLELIPDFQPDLYIRFQERNGDAVNAEYTITRTAWEELGSPSSVMITVSDAENTETVDEVNEVNETTETENLEEADAKGK